MTSTLVALNPAARQGSGRARLAALGELLHDAEIVETTADRSWEVAVARSLAAGTRRFVAAGGDGTVHALVGALVRARPDAPLHDLALGAVGLGSSNDFHKPVSASIGGLPVRLDADAAAPRDVLVARWDDGHEDVIVVSASMGVTAAANHRFNHPGPVLALLQRVWLDGAILWAAVSTLLAWRDVGARVEVDDHRVAVGLTNVSVLETPWLSGGLRYDLPDPPGGGRFAVALAHDQSLPRRLGLLVGLVRGRFHGRPGTRVWSTTTAAIHLDQPAALELDGEVVTARSVRVHVHPFTLPVCGPGGPRA